MSRLELQSIIGTDKRNPKFTICRSSVNPEEVYVFFGAELMEVVREDKKDPQFKLMIARMYNAGVKAKSLNEHFGVDPKTMKNWGKALKSGDPYELIRVLSGPGAPRKLTKEIEGYVGMRFPKIYAETHYKYSARMRAEIKEVFGQDLSAETLRPLLRKLKESLGREAVSSEIPLPVVESKPEPACDCEGSSAPVLPMYLSADEIEPTDSSSEDGMDFDGPAEVPAVPPKPSAGDGNRKDYPVSYVADQQPVLCYHAGILLYSGLLAEISRHLLLGEIPMIIQWLITVLLGAANIEQTKLLDFGALQALLGTTDPDRYRQRLKLSSMANPEALARIFQANWGLVKGERFSDFYYDPHAKQYTGIQKILKGWCGSIHAADKILNMDFVHTPEGHPVYVEHHDNYDDMRVRFRKMPESFRQTLAVAKDKSLTFIVDRGIFSFEVFREIADSQDHLITWEKGNFSIS